MANTLPAIGGDSGVWGTELNTWLLGDHTPGGLHAFTSFTPADQGFLAWSQDPAAATSNVQITAGNVLISRVNVRYSMSVFNVNITTAAAATLTSGQNFAALFDSTGTRVGVTADQTTPWATAALQSMALTGGPFTLSTGFYWVAVVSQGATPINVTRGAGQTPLVNAGLTAATARSATAATGQTSMPSSFTPGSSTLNNVPFWCALS